MHFKRLNFYWNIINLYLCIISYNILKNGKTSNQKKNYYYGIPISATLIFRFLEGIDIDYSKIINELSSITLAIYLIYESTAFKDNNLDTICKIDNLYQNKKFPLFIMYQRIIKIKGKNFIFYFIFSILYEHNSLKL